MNAKYKAQRLYNFSLLLLFLSSMHVWFFWKIKPHYIAVFITLISIYFIRVNNISLKYSKNIIIAFLLLIISGMFGLGSKFGTGHLAPLFLIIPIYILTCINDKQLHQSLLNYITNFFAYLLPISLFVYVVSYFLSIPDIGKISPSNSGDYSSYLNYIICLKNTYRYNYRFSAIFMEPGHLGMIMSYLLYAQKYNFKDNRVKIILVASLFTLSLAAYMLIFLGYLLYLYSERKINVKYVFAVFISISILWLLSAYYNGGDNFLYEKIFERLKYDPDNLIAGNNRTYGVTDTFFLKMIKTKFFWFGIGFDNYIALMEVANFGGAGWKAYIMQRGFLSLLLVIIGYLFLGFSFNEHRRYTIGFTILFAISFWQRAYPLWASWLIPYCMGISIHGINLKMKKVNK